jgi:hypothetical protein
MLSLLLTVRFAPTTVLLWFSPRGGSEMHFGTMCTKQDHAVTGVLYDKRNVYEGLSQLSDMRKARAKLSRLETVRMIIVMAKLRGNGQKIFRRSNLEGFSLLTPLRNFWNRFQLNSSLKV